jgi:hypothetical protein
VLRDSRIAARAASQAAAEGAAAVAACRAPCTSTTSLSVGRLASRYAGWRAVQPTAAARAARCVRRGSCLPQSSAASTPRLCVRVSVAVCFWDTHGNTQCAIYGNFSAPKAQEVVVSRGHVLELIRPADNGRLQVRARNQRRAPRHCPPMAARGAQGARGQQQQQHTCAHRLQRACLTRRGGHNAPACAPPAWHMRARARRHARRSYCRQTCLAASARSRRSG